MRRTYPISDAVMRTSPSAGLAAEFKRIFGVPMPRDQLRGFDVVSFDRWLGARERSCFEVAVERYGERAGALLREITSHDPRR